MLKKTTERLLTWILHPDWSDDIIGDLEEIYERNREKGKITAELKYFGQSVMLLRPTLIRRFNLLPNNNTGMLRNYFKISVRNLLRHKLATFINVLGLALGLAVFLFINEYISFEKSYDRQFKTSENLYRLTTTAMVNDVPEAKDAMASYSTGITLFNALPEVKDFTVTNKFDPGKILRMGQKVIQENRVISGDSNFFSLFTYEVLKGNPETFLSEPYQMVLTRHKAIEYFGSVDSAIGKTIEILDTFDKEFVVSGVIEDTPQNTHYKFDLVISDPSLKDREDYESWNYDNYYVYVLLDPESKPEDLRQKLDDIHKSIYDHNKARWELGKVTDIHLKSDFTFEPEAPGSETAIRFLRYISIFILFIAWVNYINLSTARAIERAKEVGLRKVVGAYRGQLIGQFLTEALLINLIATIVALALIGVFAPAFNMLAGKMIMTDVWLMGDVLLMALLFFLIGTVLSGFYPALVLSGYKPSEVLKGKFRNSRKGIVLRKALVIVQFTASILLISGTLIIQRQLDFVMSKDLGINTEQVISFKSPNVIDEETAHRSDLLKEKLLEHSAVVSIGKTSNVPGGKSADINSTTSTLTLDGFPEPFKGTTYMQIIDDGFIPTVDMQLLAGRNFDRQQASDSLSLMVNEVFLNNFPGLTADEALDKEIRFGSDKDKYRIIGVVKNFNRTSLKMAVEPTIYFPFLYTDFFVMKLSAGQVDDGLLYLEKTWNEFYPEIPLDYSFLDARFASLYQEDRRFATIFMSFSVFAIFIALLGLFGLASFMASQRTKEVGIRKVLGASVGQIIRLFVGEFLILVGIAAILGLPLIFVSMESWLGNYAYRIDFPWFIAVIGILIMAICAIGTVIFQINKVARSQPADSLQYE